MEVGNDVTKVDRYKEYTDSEFQEASRGLFTDLGTKDADILDLFSHAFGDDGSVAKQSFVQLMMQKRMQTVSGLTNLFRTLHETAMAIIRNMRL